MKKLINLDNYIDYTTQKGGLNDANTPPAPLDTSSMSQPNFKSNARHGVN